MIPAVRDAYRILHPKVRKAWMALMAWSEARQLLNPIPMAKHVMPCQLNHGKSPCLNYYSGANTRQIQASLPCVYWCPRYN